MQNMIQAMAVLDAMHHWTIQTHNRNGERRCHECTIWNGGRRVTAQARTPLAAVQRALSKLGTESRRAKGKESARTDRPRFGIVSCAD